MKKQKLTCNQAIVLMDIYRGTFNMFNHMATVPDDLRALEGMGLLERISVVPNWSITPAGDKRVKEMLG